MPSGMSADSDRLAKRCKLYSAMLDMPGMEPVPMAAGTVPLVNV